MKKLLAISAAVAIVAMASSAMAAGNTTLNVTATVNGTCSMAGPGTLNFGLLDPAVAGASATANSAGITITCSNGTPYTVTHTSTGLLSDGAGDSIAYALTLPGAGAGVGTGIAGVPYIVQGDIAAGSFFGKPANIYNETVTLNITP
jgi:spore coat protein U-like protein